MKRPILLAYQFLIGLSDSITGVMLIAAPRYTLGMMGLHVPSDTLPFISFIGVFVLLVGLPCLYAAFAMVNGGSIRALEMIWLLTGFTRMGVASFLASQVFSHAMESGWLATASFDGACALIQAVGLRRGWLAYAVR